MCEISHLPNDIVAEVRKACFEMFLKSTFYSWTPVIGCVNNRRDPPRDFIGRAASWTLTCLNSFQPNSMQTSAFRKYLETHKKYAWVDKVLIDVSIKSTDMALIVFEFQKMFGCVQVSGSNIRIDFKTQIRDWVAFTMNACSCDAELFEWKPLILKIDIEREIVYFEDPFDGRKSRMVYNRDSRYDYDPSDDDPIPWLVYVP